MDKILTTDCYTVTDKITDYELDIGGDNPNGFSKYLEKHTSMIVLTVEQFNEIIKEKEDKAFNDGWCAGNQKLNP